MDQDGIDGAVLAPFLREILAGLFAILFLHFGIRLGFMKYSPCTVSSDRSSFRRLSLGRCGLAAAVSLGTACPPPDPVFFCPRPVPHGTAPSTRRLFFSPGPQRALSSSRKLSIRPSMTRLRGRT